MTRGERPQRVAMTGPASWDQRYAGEGYSFGTAPNAFLVSRAELFQPGQSVFVPADGEGRNGVWLAQRGLDVTSADYSPVGLEKAGQLASARGVPLRTLLADLTRWDWPEAVYDRVVAIYFHLPPSWRASVHRGMARALKPGGIVLIEGFRPAQIELQKTEDSGGPPDAAMLFTPEMLRADFAGLEELQLEECETVLDEGPFHSGRAAVIRYVARKR